MRDEPTSPYVYQPGPHTGKPGERIYGVGGPGAEPYFSKRYTKAEAQQIVDSLILKSVGLGNAFSVLPRGKR